MTYIVEVNQKYIVQVESHSNAGAEHTVLDLPGMNSALSFDADSMGTDEFKWAVMNCEMISFAELEKRAFEAVKKTQAHLNELKKATAEAEKAVQAAEAELERAKAARLDAEKAEAEYQRQARACRLWVD